MSRINCIAAAVVALAGTATAKPYRTIDGSGNNLADGTRGAVHTHQSRIGGAHYTDGFGGMINRGNPRAISNAVGTQTAAGNTRDLSSMFWQWGQFIDHDLVLTETGAEFSPMFAPAGDPEFAAGEMLPFTRSLFDNGVGAPRDFQNSITHWLDGSMVYGSDAVRATTMRELSGGRMLTDGDMLIRNTANLAVANDTGVFANTDMFLAGDVRATEQTGLAAMHTLFVREHNRWADRLSNELDLTGLTTAQADEYIYQTARKIVGAEVQKITYSDWLPAFMGPQSLGSYGGYDDSVDPTISVEFSTAAFRFGHTMLNEELKRYNADGTDFAGGHLSLRDAFFDPTTMDTADEMDAILRGLAWQEANEFDTQVVDSARSFLFGPPGAGGLDLLSANINRGRDHGLGSYNEIRVDMGLAPAADFLDLTGGDAVLAAALQSIYTDVNDVDAIIGMLAEEKLAGASVGETVALILRDQFERLRDGDRFFYLNDLGGVNADIAPYLAEIEATTLGDIMALNTGADNLQFNVFFVPAPASASLMALGGLLATRRRRA